MKRSSSLFGLGIFVWIASMMLLFVVDLLLQPGTSPEVMLMGALGKWWIGFGLGAVFILLAGLKKIPLLSSALSAYVLPVLVLGGIILACLLVYPDPGLRESLLGYIPVVVVFYAAGWGWALLRKGFKGEWVRLVLPPVLGGVMLILMVAIPVFTSNAFIYRDAFVLKIQEMNTEDGKISAKCVLEINKPGDYRFQVPNASIFDAVGFYEGDPSEIDVPKGVLVWTHGKPEAGAEGSYELIMEWPVSVRALANTWDFLEFMPVHLEVRDGGSEPAKFLVTVPASPQAP